MPLAPILEREEEKTDIAQAMSIMARYSQNVH
jgi:hypothetical protein